MSGRSCRIWATATGITVSSVALTARAQQEAPPPTVTSVAPAPPGAYTVPLAPNGVPAGYPAYPTNDTVRVEGLDPEKVAPPPNSKTETPAHTGFQLAARFGLSLPMGESTGDAGDNLSRRFGWQIPLIVDLGWKVTDAIFIGAYGGLVVGAYGDDNKLDQYCDHADGVDCSTFGQLLGAEIHYSFDPGSLWNPYVGYGIGFERLAESLSDDNRNYKESTALSGITVGRLIVGADYRQKVGVGPYAELAVGRFLHTSTEINGSSASGTISEQTFHAWLTFGLRIVVMP